MQQAFLQAWEQLRGGEGDLENLEVKTNTNDKAAFLKKSRMLMISKQVDGLESQL